MAHDRFFARCSVWLSRYGAEIEAMEEAMLAHAQAKAAIMQLLQDQTTCDAMEEGDADAIYGQLRELRSGFEEPPSK